MRASGAASHNEGGVEAGLNRRAFVTAGFPAAFGIAGASAPARAQKKVRVGFLTASDLEPGWSLFRKAMAALGYVDGQGVTYEIRVGKGAMLDVLAAELVQARVDLIVAVFSPAIAAAKRATSTIPIVFNGAAPEAGIIGNVARPEGNLTGATSPGSVVAGKGVQLFHELRPDTRIGLLFNIIDPFHVPLENGVNEVVRALKIDAVPLRIKPDEIAGAFGQLANRQASGVLIQPSLGLGETAQLALKHKMPAFSFRREFTEKGGLMAYAPSETEISRIVAGQVDRILKGAKPANLPVQQITKFELTVNQKTARAIGFVFPPLFLARVDEIIE